MIIEYWKRVFETDKTENQIFVARFFAVFSFLVILSSVITAYLAFFIGANTSRGTIILLLGALAGLNLGGYLLHKQIKVGATILSLEVAGFMLLLLPSFNSNQNTPSWYCAAIIMVILLLGRKWGSFVSALFILFQSIIYMELVDTAFFPAGPFVLTLVSEIIITFLLSFYLKFNENKDQELMQSQAKLQAEVSKKEAAEAQLQENLSRLKTESVDTEKNKTALLNVLEDLNDEKQKLIDREDELIAAQKIGKFGSFNWNLKTNDVKWSQESFRIHGFVPTVNLVPPPLETYYAAVHPDDKTAAQKSMADAVKIVGENEFVYRVIWPDTSTHWVKVASTVVPDEVNTPAFLKGTFQDITREIEYQVKIEKEKAKDDAILASIADGLFMADPQGVLTLMNTAAEHMFGLNKDEVLGKNIRDIFPIKTKNGLPIAAEERPSAQSLQSKQITSGIYIYTRKDKTEFPASITVSPVIQNNIAVGVIEVFRDVTREENIDRMKTEFISLASHQLRTPLSAIKWNLEMLLAGDIGELTPEQKDLMKNVDLSNERMITLVNALLNVSRIESGRIIIDPKPTDMKQLVESVIGEVRQKIDARHQQLLLSAHDTLPVINIDPDLVRQVYINLLTNAIKYTPENGEIHIFISEKENEIISQISDSGYGIPLSEQPKVFEKFYRGTNIIKKVTDGNGLGLYLVKAIVESSGGKIWFQSEENKGTSFFFSLPKSGSIAKEGEVKLNA